MAYSIPKPPKPSPIKLKPALDKASPVIETPAAQTVISPAKARSLANLKMFKPGESGNKSGMPKVKADNSKPFKQALMLALEVSPRGKRSKRLRTIAEALVKEAEGGAKWAIEEVASRLDGKPAATQIHANDEVNPLAITVRHVAATLDDQS